MGLERKWIRVALVTALLACATCARAGDSTNATPHALALLSHGWGVTAESGSAAVVGIVSNTTAGTLGHVRIRASFFDAGGNVVANRAANISGLGPHGTWRFSVMAPVVPVTYKLDAPQWKP